MTMMFEKIFMQDLLGIYLETSKLPALLIAVLVNLMVSGPVAEPCLACGNCMSRARCIHSHPTIYPTKPSRKLTFMYLAIDVIQNSKKKGPEFSKEFSTILSKAFAHVNESVSDAKTRSGLERIINVWEKRSVYDSTVISGLRSVMKVESPSITPVKKIEPHIEKPSFDIEPFAKKKKVIKEEFEDSIKSPPGDPPDAEELVKALQDLENCPSTDAVVREKIARLPPEVSDITLLEKVQTREDAEKLAKQVEDACAILADYNNRLTDELEDRKNISKMLRDFTRAQRERVTITERKVEEFKEQLKRVSQVRNELKSHLQNLPYFTLLPSVTGGLAPLPSAGDLFNQPFKVINDVLLRLMSMHI